MLSCNKSPENRQLITEITEIKKKNSKWKQKQKHQAGEVVHEH